MRIGGGHESARVEGRVCVDVVRWEVVELTSCPASNYNHNHCGYKNQDFHQVSPVRAENTISLSRNILKRVLKVIYN